MRTYIITLPKDMPAGGEVALQVDLANDAKPWAAVRAERWHVWSPPLDVEVRDS